MARIQLLGCMIVALAPQAAAYAGWPFFADDGIRRGSPEYYQLHSEDPPGARQVYKHGKLWPPYPRATGPHQSFIHKYHHTHFWPYPYTCEDRAAVRSFVNAQVSNGWLEQTTLYDFHFDPLSNDLNSSGREHLHWIMVHVPAEYQQVNVAVAAQPEKTSMRTANVQREIAKIAGANPGFPITTRIADPVGRPASEVQSIFTSARENMPAPILSQSIEETGTGATN